MADITKQKFLDSEGVKTLWSKVKENLDVERARIKAIEDDYLVAADKEALQDNIDAVNTKVGEIPVGEDNQPVASDVIAYINKKTEGIATDAALGELQASVTQLGKDVDAIEADYLTSADKNDLSGLITAEKERAEAAEKANAEGVAANLALINTILGNEDADATDLNSIKDLVAWIEEHGEDAAAMAEAIEALEAKLVLGTDAEGKEYATVKAYVEAVIEALKTGDVKGLEDRIKALEDAGYQNAEQVGNAIDAKVEALKLDETYEPIGAEGRAKAYADGLAGNYDAAGSAAAAEGAAKAHAEAKVKELADGQVTTNKNDIADIIAAMPEALTAEEINAAIAAAEAVVNA
jgi:hypothetical protein